MFDSLSELSTQLASTGHFIDPIMTQIVYLAAKLKKPLLLEGPAGSGKTQLAISVAAAAGTHVERLQCYPGMSEDKAIGSFDESLQRLYMEVLEEPARELAVAAGQSQGQGFLSTRTSHPRPRIGEAMRPPHR